MVNASDFNQLLGCLRKLKEAAREEKGTLAEILRNMEIPDDAVDDPVETKRTEIPPVFLQRPSGLEMIEPGPQMLDSLGDGSKKGQMIYWNTSGNTLSYLDPPAADSKNYALIISSDTGALSWSELTSITVQTTYQIDTGTNKFQKKTRTASVLSAGTESAWTDVHTGTTCS